MPRMSVGVGPFRFYGDRSPRAQARRNLAVRAHQQQLIADAQRKAARKAYRRSPAGRAETAARIAANKEAIERFGVRCRSRTQWMLHGPLKWTAVAAVVLLAVSLAIEAPVAAFGYRQLGGDLAVGVWFAVMVALVVRAIRKHKG